MTFWKKSLQLNALGASDPKNIHKILGLQSSTIVAWYAGYTSSGDLLDIMGDAAKTLADAGSPPVVRSAIRGADGNRIQAFNYATSGKRHSLAHAAWMNIFSTSFTMTYVARSNAESQCFGHFSTTPGSGGGIKFGSIREITFWKADGTADGSNVLGTDVRSDGEYHILHLRRTGNVVILYIDGVAGTPRTMTTGGADCSATMYLGSSQGSADFNGEIVYTRFNNTYLTDAQIAREVSLWQGLGVGSTWQASPTFSRGSTAYQTYSDGSLALRASNTPRIGSGGGVLIEELRENKCLYSNDLTNATWVKLDGAADTISANGSTDDTGNAVMDGVVGFTNDVAHGVTQDITLTAATWAFRLKAKAGNKGWVYFADNTVANATGYVNLSTGALGTIGAGFSGVTAELKANSTVLIKGKVTGTVATHTWQFGPAHADTDNDFAGDGLTVNAWFSGFQVELGDFSTSQIDTTSAAVTRSADNLTVLPYRLRNTLKDVISTVPTMWLDFTQDPSGSTIMDNSGAYTLTKTGQPKHYKDSILGDYHAFDGANDLWVIPHASFGNPAGDFSYSAVVIPSTILSTGVIAGKWKSVGNQLGWILYRDGANAIFRVSHDGSTATSLTKSTVFSANKPALVTATYSTTTGLSLYVDAMTVATQADTGVAYASTSDFVVGADGTGSTKFAGGMQFHAYYNGTALSQANHDAMYAALKQDGILPTEISHSSHYTKLRITGAYKHIGLATAPSASIFGIGGGSGTVGLSTGVVEMFTSSTYLIVYTYCNGVNIARYMSAADVTHNMWNTFDVMFDFANLANSSGLVNGAAMMLTPSMEGTDKHISFLDTAIRWGQNYFGTISGNCEIKDLKFMVA
jgi:hypothetical protein